ncbi:MULTISPECIES: hypothetical protein [unclassified Streptomyces]|uniref:hypothetical protein n=1 Tax=unclassified Streptomyces TaxID=2593676 RepID=UPI002250B123|nr:hypothetical protein [Streptomyces sp. NBC_01264]MCX4783983.1 hypothetical protein [Streptomyces sp. NBC_01264]
MNASTLSARVPDLAVVAPSRALPPRPYGQRPEQARPLPAPALASLETRRLTMNQAALAAPGPLHVLLYALTGPHREANGDLAAARGYAQTQHLTVAGPPIVDTLDEVDIRTGGDDPLLRRGYARALRMVADPDCAVRGVVAVSRTAITAADRLYADQLTWYADRRAGLWLVRGETQI